MVIPKRVFALAAFLLTLAVAGCSAQYEAKMKAERKAQERSPYINTNDLEYDNYNTRQQIADDPTTILWCTSSFSNPSSPMFTVAIVGKLTSSNKRPFTSDPGPDGMYGSSGEYRYGFGPGGKAEYYDFYALPTFCTTVPKVWQRESTVLVVQTDPVLMDAQNKARSLLASGKQEEAEQVLVDAIKKAGGK